MRVVMLSKACIVGAYQTKLEEIAKHPDIQLTVVVPPFWRDERGVIPLERAHPNGYALLVAPMRFNGQFHFHYYPTFSSILQRVRPDIVHIDEEPYNLATFLAMRAARRVNAKTLFFTWQNILRRYPPPFAWMEAHVLRHADYAIAGNVDAIDVLRAKNYRGKASVIPQFGVDAAHFAPAAKNISPIFRIGYAGRLVAEKGIDVLLDAVAKLNGEWKLTLLGSGPHKTNLQTHAHQLGIASRVHFDAPIPSTQMPTFFHSLDVFVLPSRSRANWKEQFGRVLIEAMACEIPAIGSTCGEIPNVIGDAGLIFPEGEVVALSNHLAQLQNDSARRIEFGKRGRARVLAQFTHAHIAEETVRVYRAMLGL
jgi:glycosyltransferase involved in cell wall biosynthesis